MKVDLKNEKQNKVLLTIEIEPEKIEEAYKKELAKICREIKLDGFRKGKAPVNMVKGAVGEEYIYKEVLDTIIPDSYSEAIYLKNITPLANPEFKDMGKIEKDKPFIYKLLIEVKPKADIENYTGIEIEQEKKEIDDKEIEKQLETMQKQLGKLVNIEEDRALQMDDFASCDYEIRMENEEKAKNPVKEQIIKVQEYKELPGFAENIVGLKPGEEKEFTLEVKEQDTTKKAFVKFKLHEIKKESLPELNDDFAKTIAGYYTKESGGFKGQTIEELKNEIKTNLLKNEEEKVKHEVRNKVLEKIMDKNTIEATPGMINYELNFLLNDFESQLQRNGLNIENYIKATNKTIDDIKTELKPQAERLAKVELALDCIAEKEKIEITDEDLEKELERTAEALKQDKEQIIKNLETQKTMNNFKYNLLREKVINYLIEKSNIKYKTN